MKAVYIGKTTRELKDTPVPDPAAGEILIKSGPPLSLTTLHLS